MKLLDYSDPIEEFKKLNIEDKKGSQEDEDDPIQNLNDNLNNLNINNSEQLTERGKAKCEQNLEVRLNPYKRNDFRLRNDSTDSGNFSDGSINSPSSLSNESIITPFEENTCQTKLVSLKRWQEKTETSQKSSPVRCKTIPRFSSDKHIERLPSVDLVSNKTEEQKESAIISKSEEKISNLKNTSTVTGKKTLEQQLNPVALKQKWLDLIVFPKEDIYATDSEGLTIFHRLLKTPEDDHIPEALYTVMEEFKQHPSKCRDLLDSKDAILNSLQALHENKELLEKYFRISFIVISLLHDYNKKGTSFPIF